MWRGFSHKYGRNVKSPARQNHEVAKDAGRISAERRNLGAQHPSLTPRCSAHSLCFQRQIPHHSARPNSGFNPELTLTGELKQDFTLMMLLRRGAAFTDSRRKVSVSWAAAGTMTPLRRPRDALGGMKSGAASLHSPSAHASRSDMTRSGI